MLDVILKKREDHRLREGSLWVYADEIRTMANGITEGDLVRVLSDSGVSMGTGFFNPHSSIRVRLLGADVEEVNPEFFYNRFLRSNALRQRLLPGADAYRLIFGESDLLSGLIVDRYANCFVLQIVSLGMDKHRSDILQGLLSVFPETECVIEKSTSPSRTKEGLEPHSAILWGQVPDSLIVHDGPVTVSVDIAGGQKTGYFLDQRDNRRAVAPLAEGRRMLDCFCNLGGFAISAALSGAREVVGVDSSAVAIEGARRNAELNDVHNATFVQANVFDFLRSQIEAQEQWDIIVLDPPSFARERRSIHRARAGYGELTRLALKLLPEGAFLVSSSCTQVVRENQFLEIITREAARLRRRLRIVYRGYQAADHPVLPSMPETEYLKFFIFELLN